MAEERRQRQDEQIPPPDTKASTTILSRSTLYAPLAAYQQTRVAPSDYLSNVASLPKSVGEKALLQFMGHASSHHHLSSKGLHGKNTSARPLDALNMKERLQQKTLTLIGGGFYSSKSKSNQDKNNKRSLLLLSSHKTEQKRRRRKHPRPGEIKLSGQNEMVQKFLLEDQGKFVKALNAKWNDYAWSLLHARLEWKEDESSAEKLESLLSSDMSTLHRAMQVCAITAMEWVGARVEIVGCPAHKALVGRTGILCAETVNTWEVFLSKAEKDNNDDETLFVPDVLVPVPKQRGSSLTALLPIRKTSRTAQQQKPQVTQQEGDDDSKSSIEPPTHHLCFEIKGR